MNNPNLPRWANRNRNRNAEGQQAEEPEVLVISERELRIFIFRVYLFAGILCLLTAIPWLCVSGLQVRVFESIPVPPFVWIILSFVLLTILSCIPQTPITWWLCWGLVICSLIFITLYGSYYAGLLPVWLMAAAMAGSVVLLALLHLFGAKAPKVLLPNMICTCAVMLLGSIALFVLLMLAIFTEDPRFFLASAIVFFIIVCFMAPFQAAFIWGRLQHVPYGETANCSNGIYLHFCFLTLCLLVFVQLG